MGDTGTPWQLGAVVVLVALVRLAYTFWTDAPLRAGVLEVVDSGLVAFVLVFVVIRPFVVQSFFISSDSMLPCLRPADRLLVNKFIYRLTAPRRGDIIVFRAPPRAEAAPGEDYVKRVIALPGEVVEIRGGHGVYVNGRRLAEPYAKITTAGFGPHRVAPHSVFVLGDNRAASYDSRAWGDLPRRLVVGKVMVRFWPPRRAGMLARQEPLLGPREPLAPAGG